MQNFSASLPPLNLLDPQALETNRQGRLTPAQEDWLKSAVSGKGFAALLTLVFVGACVMLGISCVLIPMLIGASESPILLIVVALITLLTLVGLALPIAPQVLRWQALRADFSAPALCGEQGQLSYEKGAYHLAGLPLPEKLTAPLSPAVTYQVYYLEKSRLIVSAQAVGPEYAPAENRALTDILLAANGISPEALEACRQGELTPPLRLKALPSAIFGLIIAAAPLIVVLPIAFSLARQMQSGGQLTETLAGIAIPLLLGVVFAGLGGVLFFQGMSDLFTSAPAQVEGPGHKETRLSGGKNRTRRYFYVIEGMEFMVRQQAYQALIDGKRYRVYYLPRTKKLLAVEAL